MSFAGQLAHLIARPIAQLSRHHLDDVASYRLDDVPPEPNAMNRLSDAAAEIVATCRLGTYLSEIADRAGGSGEGASLSTPCPDGQFTGTRPPPRFPPLVH